MNKTQNTAGETQIGVTAKQEFNYQENAKNVLTEMGVKYSAKFIKHDYHFADDDNTRDIFRLTLSRGGKRFYVRFGQSLKDSTGNGDYLPTEYDLLTCIQKYDVGSFRDFCGDFGYDEDSRKAYRTYLLVCAEYGKVINFFTSEELEQLQEIQ